MQPATSAVAEVIGAMTPLDRVERDHIDEVLAWLESTDDIFRRERPATPPRHLVSYVVLVDPVGRAILLGRHRKAGLWLPTGGHVDPGEHPLAAARREAAEELGIDAEFTVVGPVPLLLTVTTTIGIDGGHEDVSLWYVIRGDRTQRYRLDPGEFDDGRWWDIDRHAIPESDQHYPRFLAKLEAALAAVRPAR